MNYLNDLTSRDITSLTAERAPWWLLLPWGTIWTAECWTICLAMPELTPACILAECAKWHPQTMTSLSVVLLNNAASIMLRYFVPECSCFSFCQLCLLLCVDSKHMGLLHIPATPSTLLLRVSDLPSIVLHRSMTAASYMHISLPCLFGLADSCWRTRKPHQGYVLLQDVLSTVWTMLYTHERGH